MVAFVLGVAVLSQQLQVSARVTPDRVLLGDTVVLSITVHSQGNEPIEIIDPPMTGLEVRGSREQSRVTLVGGLAARITQRAVTLRTAAAGTLTIPPIVVRQGGEAAETEPLTLTVDAAGAGAGAVLGERVRALVARSAAPALAAEEVAATVLVSRDTVTLGEQVDLVVVAWFPRSVRSRLRNPPTLRPPQLRGAWSYQRPSPAGIALSRRVNGIWYDLYVHHQAVFPLTVGPVNIARAVVSYTLPLTHSFLSRELRHEVETPSLVVSVRPQPQAPITGFAGAAGTGLQLRLEVNEREVPLGGAVPIAVTLNGIGNVALWPEPTIAWPPGLRVYPGDVAVSVSAEDGKLGGTKTFNYLAVADSVGAFAIPAAIYAYYDTERRGHVELRADPVRIAVAGRAPGSKLPQGAALPLMQESGWLMVHRRLASIPDWGWVLAFLLPPSVVVLLRVSPRVREAVVRRTRPGTKGSDPLSHLDRQFDGVLSRLVADAHLRNAVELADALRAAGIEGPVASHAARVRDRLQLALYGPADTTDSDELTAEVQEVLRALLGNTPRGRRSGVVTATFVVMIGFAPAELGAQSPTRLYDAGAVQVAADSFASRTVAEPHVAAHWHNLGNARYRLGDHAGAAAAWLRAARLDPRHALVKRVRALSPARDRRSAELTWVSPVTPEEALLAALLLWVMGWVLVSLRGRRRTVALVIGLALLAAGYSAYVARHYAKHVALVRVSDVALRAAPYGPAPGGAPLAGGSAVIVERERGAWVLVRRGREVGWLLRTEIVRL